MNMVWMIVLIVVVAAGLAAAFTLLGYAVIKKARKNVFWIDLLRHSPAVPVLVMGINISDTYIFI